MSNCGLERVPPSIRGKCGSMMVLPRTTVPLISFSMSSFTIARCLREFENYWITPFEVKTVFSFFMFCIPSVICAVAAVFDEYIVNFFV